jgi:hypothetical protein
MQDLVRHVGPHAPVGCPHAFTDWICEIAEYYDLPWRLTVLLIYGTLDPDPNASVCCWWRETAASCSSLDDFAILLESNSTT